MATPQKKETEKPAPKAEPTSGVRRLRVRGRLPDGREFLSASTFIVPVDPDAEAAGKGK